MTIEKVKRVRRPRAPRKQAEVTAELENITDRLMEVALAECDPKGWTGHGKQLAEMTKEERGNRHWDKTNAASTIGLIKQLYNVINVRKIGSQANRSGEDVQTGDDDDQEKLVKAAVAKAKKALDKAHSEGKVH
jgi:hypothetical protein